MKLTVEAKGKLIADSRYEDIGNLPSNFIPYEYTQLLIRPLTVVELKLISKAATLNNISYVVAAVDNCISEDAGMLSVGDFYFVLMWLKIHSTPKAPYIDEWHCTESVYRSKLDGHLILNDDSFKEPEDTENYELVPCGCHNSEPIHLTNIDILQLPEGEKNLLPEGFDFPRARDIQDTREALKDPELRFIVGPAQWIMAQPAHPGDDKNNISRKLKVLFDSSDLTMFDTAASLSATLEHGIRETTTRRCRNCAAAHYHEIRLEPYNFFR